MYSLIFLALISFALCILITPLIRNGFRMFGILDQPTGTRKIHVAAVPRIGGICIAAAYIGAFALLVLSPLHGASTLSMPFILKLLPAAAVIFATGLIDDIFRLNAWQKLTGQVMAAGLAYWAGVSISGIAGHAGQIWWSLPATVLWLVACANAFNLIDGVDGLAAGVGLFATLTTLVAALAQNNAALALATAPLAGALLGFLRYNFNPASIFLGDCGSLSIGFLLGCYGIIWSQKSATMLGMAAPLMALSIPLLDTCLAVGRRFLRLRPIFGADRNHIHHQLLDRGFSPRQVALLLYGACGIAAAFSLMQSMYHTRFSGMIIVLFCAAAWIGVQHLGYREFGAARQLVAQRTFRRILDRQLHLSGLDKKLDAAQTEAECWRIVREAAKEYGFVHVRMQLADCLYEERFEAAPPESCCSIRIPLSRTEYLNLSYRQQSGSETVLMVTDLAHLLQTRLRKWAGRERHYVVVAGGARR